MTREKLLNLKHGCAVIVTAKDYAYEGAIVSVFPKRKGAVRCVVEDDNGRLFIHNAEQIEQVMPALPKEPAPPPGSYLAEGKRYIGHDSHRRLIELFEGRWRIVKDGGRTGWWRYNEHYDRDGYCDNPARGY